MSIHDGHRKRLRKRLIAHSADALQDHELLELLLFYGKSRENTNPLAHALCREFGSLAGVLDASKEELTKIKGIGSHTAAMLTMVKPLYDRYLSLGFAGTLFLNDPETYCKAFLPHLSSVENAVYIFCLDAREQLLSSTRLFEEESLPSEATLKKALAFAASCHAVYAILAVVRSGSQCTIAPIHDIHAAKKFSEAFSSMHITLADYVIYNSPQYFSFVQNDLTWEYEPVSPSGCRDRKQYEIKA